MIYYQQTGEFGGAVEGVPEISTSRDVNLCTTCFEHYLKSALVPIRSILEKCKIIQIAKDIAPAKKFFLQNFRPEKTIDPSLETIRSYSKEFLLETKKDIAGFFKVCEVRY